jgi:oligopeptide transport system ATP-binding protein
MAAAAAKTDELDASPGPAPAAPPLLRVDGLCVRFGAVRAVEDLRLEVRQGETLAIVGESGSGKSTLGLAIMGLLPRGRRCSVFGEIELLGRDGASKPILRLTDAQLRRLRGNDVAMIFQEPMASLNPVYRVSSQILEAIRLHQRVGRREAESRTLELLTHLGIPNPAGFMASYPHQLSGGMRQRVMIAIALSCRPTLLIADEPTTALDVTIQAQILELLKTLQAETGMAMVFITHNLGVVAEIADRVAVMYAGRIVETGPAEEILRRPRMPYTLGLLRSLPRLGHEREEGEPLPAIPGTVPTGELPRGCAFHPRCGFAIAGRCDVAVPALELAEPAHEVRCLRWRELPQDDLS